jgi:short-subunit dehydrogenase
MSRRTPMTSGPGTALVTGASAGIGREFAEQLARRGHDLVLVARDEGRLEAVAKEVAGTYGVDVEVLAADLTNRAELHRVEDRLSDSGRPVSLLVNNAGIGLKGRFLDNDVEQEQAMLDLLVVAVMRLTHTALRSMVGRGSGGVIHVSSIAAFLPRGTYSAAKAWVNSFGEWAAHEYRDRGVTVTTLCPGFTRTEFHERMGVSRDSAPDFLWLDAEFLVRRALHDHERGRVWSVPGARYRTIRALTRAVPVSLLQRLQGLGRR